MCSGVLFTVLFFPFAFLPPPEDALFPHHSYRYATCLGSWPRRKSKREKGPRQRRPGESLPREDLWEDPCSSQRLVEFTDTASSAQDLWGQLRFTALPVICSPLPLLFCSVVITHMCYIPSLCRRRRREMMYTGVLWQAKWSRWKSGNPVKTKRYVSCEFNLLNLLWPKEHYYYLVWALISLAAFEVVFFSSPTAGS